MHHIYVLSYGNLSLKEFMILFRDNPTPILKGIKIGG